MKKKGFLLLLTIFLMSAAMAGTAAAQWRRDSNGRWWLNDDGSWPSGGFTWLDADSDGFEECYYFDQNGYLLTNTITPDGSSVNADGMWTINNIVQKKALGSGNNDGVLSLNGYYKGYMGYTDWNLNEANDADERYDISYGWQILEVDDNTISVLSDQYANLAPTIYYKVSDYVYEVPCSDHGSEQIVFNGSMITSICTSSQFKNAALFIKP